MMYCTTKVFLIISTFYFATCSKLVVILMDGFRWDYFDHVNLPGFANMAKEGVKAEYMLSDYPTLSYPNYYSIMTGLHCESHGMVGNFMHDVTNDKNFLIGVNPDQNLSIWWDDAEPVWITAEKEGKKSYFFYWPGCEVTIRGRKPTLCVDYKLSLIPEFEYSLQETLKLLHNDTADLIGIYLEAPDHYGHKFGVDSQNLTTLLQDIDNSLQSFRQRLTSLNLQNDANIMIFSDHGMTNITKMVNITDVLDLQDIKVILSEVPYVSIWPMNGKLEKVYNDLVTANKPNVTVYKKELIPDRYRLKNHPRTAPIVIEADSGTAIVAPWKCNECAGYFKPGTTSIGMHGYDNTDPDMRAIFRATGPAFRKNFVSKPIANVELYQIMCDILGIKPKENNGTWSKIAQMMIKTDTSSARPTELFFPLFLFGMFNVVLN
ncbi:glycerophosphocholine cholinephosphodiesterase ENPP6-like [Saccostrea echinata]|uniref:glycerophosphocholine cholinephosphodiesterase ENPP6-like n=1 Tax=Saccostrea echinata TaxID=191078 RepID=UPI002A80DBD0|nr:glycerophosphocholine cholinephosphodiesterase ENPP6-like [Saccostrea echinata]XP_061163270.1 glycerophosphocholine cholinephosphodiesterase ENPP6-like [Saccostrea echinata]XP_061163271.1 glycerophosphocholine cholinephosphodiesterase ENPP6-like [Saccostrea echinata]